MQFIQYFFTKLFSLTVLLGSSTFAFADIITFDFTGRITVMGQAGEIVPNTGTYSLDPYGLQSPIHSTFTYDTTAGIGTGDLIISPLAFFSWDVQLHDISMDRIEGTNYVLGNMLMDFSVNTGVPVSLVWDATGLINAIEYGLQAGDVISGTNLKRDGTTVFDVSSATPASDGYDHLGYIVDQGPAPLATTTLNTASLCTGSYPGSYECMDLAISGSEPFLDDGIAGSPLIDGPFPEFQISIDIGSGNSLTVLSVSAVPVPAAVWLFSTGLIALIGIAKRKS